MEVFRQLGLCHYLPIEPVVAKSSLPNEGFRSLDFAPAEALDFLSRGGKFLRPLLTLAAFDAVASNRGVGRELRDVARAAALAIEVFHKASLVHDDIEDDDSLRYGVAAVHESIGVPAAINVGDFLVGLGYAIVASLPAFMAKRSSRDDPSLASDLLAVLADCHLKLARGQGAELWWRECPGEVPTPSDVLAVYGLKTSPAFEAALSMGVRIAGLRPREAGPIEEFARHVGTGFQILNDLKDWNGDTENKRLPAGDVLCGRPNVLLSLAVRNLSPADSKLLREAISHGGSAMNTIARLLKTGRVFEEASLLLAAERRKACVAAAQCSLPRLELVMTSLLHLAIPVEHPVGR